MLTNVWGQGMCLQEGELLRREGRNRKYMMDLRSENLLLNFNLEAGRPTPSYEIGKTHGGWETLPAPRTFSWPLALGCCHAVSCGGRRRAESKG